MAKDNNTLLIVGGLAVVGLVVYAMMNKNNAAQQSSNNGGSSQQNYSSGSAQNISAFGNLFAGLGSGFASVWGSVATPKAGSAAISGSGSNSMV